MDITTRVRNSCLFVYCIFFYSCVSNAGPIVKFQHNELQIGSVKAGQRKTVTTLIENVGREPLIIYSVTAGCQCTDVKISQDTIAASEKAVLSITYVSDTTQKNNEIIDVAVVVRNNTKEKFNEFHLTGAISR